MNSIPPHVLNGSPRQVLYDTLVFQGWDLYHAEFVLRQGPDVLMELVAEVLNLPIGMMLRQSGLCQSGTTQTGDAVKHYILQAHTDPTHTDPTHTGPEFPALVLTETMLAFLLFLDAGAPNATFRIAFTLSTTVPYTGFRAGLRAALKDHPHVPWFGRELHRVFVEEGPPTRDSLITLAKALQERVIPLLPNISPDTQTPDTPPLDPRNRDLN